MLPYVSESEDDGEEGEIPWWHDEPKMEDALIELFDYIKESVDSGSLPESSLPEKPEQENPLSEKEMEKIVRENHRMYGVGDAGQLQKCSFCGKSGHNMRTCPVRKNG